VARSGDKADETDARGIFRDRGYGHCAVQRSSWQYLFRSAEQSVKNERRLLSWWRDEAEKYMDHKLNATLLAMTAGLLGGLASRYISPSAVFAQAQKAAPKEIQAQNFVLVNAQGNPMGLFGFNPQGKPIIKLVDERGMTIWTSEVPLVPGAPEPK
jgi:hypothetical protein